MAILQKDLKANFNGKASLMSSPGARFSTDPKTLRARKATHKTPTRLFRKAGPFVCCNGNKTELK